MSNCILDEKIVYCSSFFNCLSEKLNESYSIYGSCNNDCSKYLVPNGAESEVTYYGKPELSFRVSDHWNWYSNIIKCNIPNYIQCFSPDFPWVRKRKAEGKASVPVLSASVCIYLDGAYHVIYGEKFDRKTKKWSWIESTPDEIIEKYFGGK